jgi:hypothetical protein
MMRADDVQSFLDRDWEGLAALKREHWAERFRIEGAEATMHASQMLWGHARRVRPDWPTARERAEHLTHHVELKRLIDQAAHAFADR